MTATIDLLDRLTADGVLLAVVDGDIVYRGPKVLLTSEVLAELAARKTEVVGLLSPASSSAPPCPSDIFERGAMLIESAGMPPQEADFRALDEYGFPSWSMLANAHRVHVVSQIRGSTPSDRLIVGRLATATHAFMDTRHWQDAIRTGWTMTELFGVSLVAPIVRVDGYGLVPSQSMSKLPGGEIVSVTDYGAVIRFPTGSQPTFYRGKPGLDNAVPWWECDALVGGHDGAPPFNRSMPQQPDASSGA